MAVHCVVCEPFEASKPVHMPYGQNQFNSIKLKFQSLDTLFPLHLLWDSLVNARGYYEEVGQEVLCDASRSVQQEQTDAREVPEVSGR